jgi:hypothetical protein
VPSDGCSTDCSCALQSVAEVGLSARTREETGHCSNAGGLSAVGRDPLYRNRRLRVLAGRMDLILSSDTRDRRSQPDDEQRDGDHGEPPGKALGTPRVLCAGSHSGSSFDCAILTLLDGHRTGSEPPSRGRRMSNSNNATRHSTIAVGPARSRRIGSRGIGCVVVAVCIGAITSPQASGPIESAAGQLALPLDRPTLTDAQSLFYNARYEAAAALALALRVSDSEDLANKELRSSALLFQIKALLERRRDEAGPLKNCATCPDLIAEFLADIRDGQNIARTTLRSTPGDEAALFFLGKLDLNYLWLQLGPLRRKTGWDEYWEARRSLDAVLIQNPQHVRARVARAWIDYIVDTKMPWGTRWLLGGGNRKRALIDVRETAQIESDFFSHAEAEFALWDMEVRERNMAHATDVARRLALNFPDNRELAAFLKARDTSSWR